MWSASNQLSFSATKRSSSKLWRSSLWISTHRLWLICVLGELDLLDWRFGRVWCENLSNFSNFSRFLLWTVPCQVDLRDRRFMDFVPWKVQLTDTFSGCLSVSVLCSGFASCIKLWFLSLLYWKVKRGTSRLGFTFCSCCDCVSLVREIIYTNYLLVRNCIVVYIFLGRRWHMASRPLRSNCRFSWEFRLFLFLFSLVSFNFVHKSNFYFDNWERKMIRFYKK